MNDQEIMAQGALGIQGPEEAHRGYRAAHIRLCPFIRWRWAISDFGAYEALDSYYFPALPSARGGAVRFEHFRRCESAPRALYGGR